MDFHAAHRRAFREIENWARGADRRQNASSLKHVRTRSKQFALCASTCKTQTSTCENAYWLAMRGIQRMWGTTRCPWGPTWTLGGWASRSAEGTECSGPPERGCARRPLGASRHQCGFWSPSWSRGQSIANARLLDRACGFFERRPALDQRGVRRPVGAPRAPRDSKLQRHD